MSSAGSPTIAEVAQRAREYAQGQLALLETWVNQNSFSANVAGCQRQLELLDEAFSRYLPVRARQRGEGCGDHMAWMSPAWERAAPSERMLWIGHHDTVFPPGTFEGFSLDGAYARGPGVLDMKGGFYVMLAALAGLAHGDGLARVPLAVVSVADEETGSAHSQPWLRTLAQGCGAALVFESGRAADRIVVARKGTGKVTLTATGKAAHAGNALLDGRNAIWALARVIDAVSLLTDLAAGTSVNVGVIAGGTTANTVPVHARCELDLRCADPAAAEALLAEIRAIAARIGQGMEVAIAVTGGWGRTPLTASRESLALAAAYADAARAEGLGSEVAPQVGGGSDANTVGALGVPVIDALGPRGAGFHTTDEHIELDSLPAKSAAVVRLVGARYPTLYPNQ